MPTRRTGWTGTLAFALAALALPAACRRAETDQDRIRALFERAAGAAEEKRIGDVVADVSESFRAGELDRDGARRLAAGVILRGGWLSASVSGAAIRVEGDLASAVVDVVLARGAPKRSLASLAPHEASVHRFDVRLAREVQGWRVTGASWRAIELADAIAGPPDPAEPSSEASR
jgi:hypothetical protein